MRHKTALSMIAGLALLATIDWANAGELRRWQGMQNGTTEPRTMIVKTQAEWRELWAIVSSPPPEDFDDRRHAGIAIFLGRRGGEGYAVHIASMAPRKDQFVVEVDEIAPATRGGGATSTTPWLILLIDRPELPIVIEPRFRTRSQ